MAVNPDDRQRRMAPRPRRRKRLGVGFFGASLFGSLSALLLAAAGDSPVMEVAVAACFALAAFWALRFSLRNRTFSGVVATTMFCVFAVIVAVVFFAKQETRREQAGAGEAARAESERPAE